MTKNYSLRHIHFNSSVFVLIYSATVLLTELYRESKFTLGEFTSSYLVLVNIGLVLVFFMLCLETYLISVKKVFNRCEKIGFYLNIGGLILLLLPLMIRIF